MTLSLVSLLPVILTCAALFTLSRRRQRAELRRRRFVGCLEKALTGSAEIHS